MNNITYLFGAGASADIIPTQARISKQINAFIEYVNGNRLFQYQSTDHFHITDVPNCKVLFDELIHNLKWLEKEAGIRGSVDTYARLLFMRQDFALLNKLKIIYSAFFVFYQAWSKGIDKRYGYFFNSVFKNRIEFPSQLKIISWNYDLQFEKAISEYSPQIPNFREIHKQLGFYSDQSNNNNVSIFKLNGTAGFENIDPCESDLNPKEFDRKCFDSILRTYGTLFYRDTYQSPLSFAWEKKDNIIPTIIDQTKATDTLIIIGYSLPDLNREIDFRIIQNMSLINQIFVQDENAHELIRQLKSHLPMSDGIEFVPITQIVKFHMPTDLIRQA